MTVRKRSSSRRRSRLLPLSSPLNYPNPSLFLSICLSVSLFPPRLPHSAPTRSCRTLPFSPITGFDREYRSFVTGVSTDRRSGWWIVGRLREGERAQLLPSSTPLPRPCGRPTRPTVATAMVMAMAQPGRHLQFRFPMPTPEEARHSSRRVLASSRFTGSPGQCPKEKLHS